MQTGLRPATCALTPSDTWQSSTRSEAALDSRQYRCAPCHSTLSQADASQRAPLTNHTMSLTLSGVYLRATANACTVLTGMDLTGIIPPASLLLVIDKIVGLREGDRFLRTLHSRQLSGCVHWAGRGGRSDDRLRVCCRASGTDASGGSRCLNEQ